MRKRTNALSALLAPVALGAFFFLFFPILFPLLPCAASAVNAVNAADGAGTVAITARADGINADGICADRKNASVSAAAFIGERKLPRGAAVNGVSVGGLTEREAREILCAREEKNVPALVVETPAGNYAYAYPDVGFFIDFSPIFERAQRNGKYEIEPRYFVNGLEEKAERICADNRKSAQNACVRFGENGFSFDGEQDGIVCDKERLKREMKEAVLQPPTTSGAGARAFPRVRLFTQGKKPEITIAAAKNGTRLIGEFTTWFSPNDGGRCANIALAAKKLNGSVVRAGEEFSFNAAVGERTKKQGFQDAKIIQDGEFVLGAGGGVCQVSTTLFNAALLSGLKITARNPHSLAVAYAEPSRDAMVSSSSDLRFKNPFPYPVYLAASTGESSVTVRFFGKKTGYEYKISSVIAGEIDPPAPLVKYGDFEGEIRRAKKGIKSESYLETYFSGKLVRREWLYSDAYAPTRAVIGKKIGNTAKKTP